MNFDNLFMKEVLILITTEPDEKIAKKIAKLLLKNNLAACVSIKSIYSLYKWKGGIEETKEFEITIKSKPQLKSDLIKFLNEITSNDIPQIIYKKFQTESKYYDWLTNTF